MALFRDNYDSPFDHDRSIEDRKRHRELVDKSIKENLGDLLSEESIITESENKKFKVPIKGIKEFSFIYGQNNNGVSTGNGREKRGDKVSDSSLIVSTSDLDENDSILIKKGKKTFIKVVAK